MWFGLILWEFYIPTLKIFRLVFKVVQY